MREQQPESGSRNRDQERLDEELDDDAAAAGAERETDGDLAGAGRCPGQRQVGQVGARNEQEEPDGGKQDIQRAAQRGRRILGFERKDAGGPTLVQLRIGPPQPLRDGRHLGPCLGERDASTQPRRHVQLALDFVVLAIPEP